MNDATKTLHSNAKMSLYLYLELTGIIEIRVLTNSGALLFMS